MGKFSEGFDIWVYQKFLFKTLLVQSLYKVIFPWAGRAYYQYIEIIDFGFFLYVQFEESVVGKVGLFEKSVHHGHGGIWLIVWLVPINTLAHELIFEGLLFDLRHLVLWFLFVKVFLETLLDEKVRSSGLVLGLALLWVVLAEDFFLDLFGRLLKYYLLG